MFVGPLDQHIHNGIIKQFGSRKFRSNPCIKLGAGLFNLIMQQLKDGAFFNPLFNQRRVVLLNLSIITRARRLAFTSS
jgi:hypothetical protein